MANQSESIWSKLLVLKGAIRELWNMFACKILHIVAYGLCNGTIILWLSKDLGMSDMNAGLMVAGWSTLLTLITVMVGSLVDAIGIKKALLIGFIICIISRFIMAVTTIKAIVLPLGFMPLAVGEALMVPVMVAAIKMYTTAAQRSMAFYIFYAVMNVGFAIAGFFFDQIRRSMGETGSISLAGLNLSTYQTLIFISFLVTIPSLLIVLFGIRENASVDENGCYKEIEHQSAPASSALHACTNALVEWKRIFCSLWHQTAFYKFLAFLTIVVFVRLIFYHFHYTFPKYGIRELGEGAPIGQLWGVLNPILIIVLVPMVGALTQKLSAYKTVVIGSTIAALGPLFMAVPPHYFKSLADGPLGNFIAHTWLNIADPNVNPLYVSIFLATIFISVGEAFYSPRLYEYPAAIAPKGQEGSYMSLSMLPYFIAKFFVGILSGWLLQTFCPETGPRSSHYIWLIVGLMAIATPVCLVIFKKFIQVHEDGRE
ncbi:MAG: MFS transporter [Candidatus Bruticola sp.]